MAKKNSQTKNQILIFINSNTFYTIRKFFRRVLKHFDIL